MVISEKEGAEEHLAGKRGGGGREEASSLALSLQELLDKWNVGNVGRGASPLMQIA